MMSFRLRVAVRAAVLVAAVACGAAAAATPEDPFRQAAAQYRAGRYSDAFGRFLAMAAHGDADAARIVLFMHEFGPTLYGSYWDLNADEREAFTRLAATRLARKQPEFQPASHSAALAAARLQVTRRKNTPG